MTRTEIAAFNAGVAALAEIATASAFVLRARLTEAPTRFGFAIGALEGIVEASEALMLQTLPGEPQSGEDAGCKEGDHGC